MADERQSKYFLISVQLAKGFGVQVSPNVIKLIEEKLSLYERGKQKNLLEELWRGHAAECPQLRRAKNVDSQDVVSIVMIQRRAEFEKLAEQSRGKNDANS